MSRSSIAFVKRLRSGAADRRRCWPCVSRRAMAVVSLVVLVLTAPLECSAQVLHSFEDLPLRVNLDDQLQIEDQSGAKVSGRVTRLTPNDMTIQTSSGQKRFTSDSIRAIAARGHALRRGALVGTAVFAVLGAIAICSHEGGEGCGLGGAFGAAPIGAGVGVAIGGLIPQMTSVYRAPENRSSVPRAGAGTGVDASWLEDLALRVNLDDRLWVEERSGLRTAGRLVHLTDDDITIQTDAGEKHFTRETVRQVAVRHRPIRTVMLIGAGAGATFGAISECRGGAHADCPDGVIIESALGAGVGVLIGAAFDRATIVYPESKQRTVVLPAISRGGISVRLSRRW